MSFPLAPLAVAAALSLPFAASAATISTTAASGTIAPSIAAEVGGEAVTLSGHVVRDDLSFVSDADVGYSGTGYGVDGVDGASTIGGASVDPFSGGSSPYTIDGVKVGESFDLNEMLRLTFDNTVSLSALTFAMVDLIDDVMIRVQGGEPMRYGLGGNTSENAGVISETITFGTPLVGRVFEIVAGFPNQTCTVTGSQHCGGATDLFQLTGADVAPVPLPAGGLLLLCGFGAVAAMRRRTA